MIYLGSPYSHKEPAVQHKRFLRVADFTLKMTCAGLHVFSPIAYSGALSRVGRLPGSWEYWAAFDSYMIGACTNFAVLQLPGWELSAGLRGERLLASSMDRKELLLHPNEVDAAIRVLKAAELEKGINTWDS
jgi:hypothetical protein